MDNFKFIIPKTSIDTVRITDPSAGVDSSGMSDTFVIGICENKSIRVLTGPLTSSVKRYFGNLSLNPVPERYYLTAIDNLLKKIAYLEISSQVDQELISESEFEEELMKHDHRYLIKSDHNFDQSDFSVVMTITHKFQDRDFSTDDISEMFSIPVDKMDEFILNYDVKHISRL